VRPRCVKGGFRCQLAVSGKVVERSQGVLKGLEALGNERQFPSLLARVKAVKKLQRVLGLFDLDAELMSFASGQRVEILYEMSMVKLALN